MEKEIYLDHVRRLIDALPEARLYLARSSPLPSYIPYTLIPSPRIISVISGTKPIAFSDGREVVELDMKPGEVLYAEPYGWSNPLWKSAHEFISLVFNPDYVRVLHIKNDPEKLSAENEPLLRNWYHTSGSLCSSGTMLLNALNIMVDDPEPQPVAVNEILRSICRVALRQLERDEVRDHGKAYDTWQSVRDYMRCNRHLNITRQSVASHFRLNPGYLSRLFRKHGEGFNSYLTRLRLEQGCHLLKNRALTVDEIAYRCGFSSAGYFIKSFSQLYGATPGTYRKTIKR